MICTVIQNKDYRQAAAILSDPAVEMAEIRLDSCTLTPEETDALFRDTDTPLIATCRISEKTPAAVAESRLIRAMRAGAAYVDLEIEAPAMMGKRIRREAAQEGVYFIRSYHNFEGTDSEEGLKAIYDKCAAIGADIVKMVTTAHGADDVSRTLSLYDRKPLKTALVAFCMGEEGRSSREECLSLGAPFTYAALSGEDSAAPGQIPLRDMLTRVYGSRHFTECPEPLQMPASKSFAQRAIVAAALSDGSSVLSGYSSCGDTDSAIKAARALGATVSIRGDVLKITGCGPGHFTSNTLHTGESGLLTRLMIPVMAALADRDVTITGERTLPGRPLKGAREIMAAFGVSLESGSDTVSVPLTVHGSLRSCNAEISGADGSQLISGLLTALPLLPGDSTITVKSPKSIPYLFITVDVLKRFGVVMETEMEGGEEFSETGDWGLCDAITFKIKGGQTYTPARLHIEADWSSASPFLTAGAIFGEVALKGLDMKSLQADITIMDILSQAGASLSEEDGTGIIHCHKAPLTAFDADASNCPDLFPSISVLAAFCQGTSKIKGIGRLRGKESDRAAAILDMLAQMGVPARIKGDTLHIDGRPLARRILTGSLLKGGSYTSSHDHRMAMALKVASLASDSPIHTDDEGCIAKSFPKFVEMFNSWTSGI